MHRTFARRCCRDVDRCGDEGATAEGDRAQNVSSSLLPDGREGFRSLARRMRATLTVSSYPFEYNEL
jgi:hypothetical protein